MVNRRNLIRMTGVGAAVATSRALASVPAASAAAGSLNEPFRPSSGPRLRMLYLNDLSGDFDGLFSAVHAILSPSIDLRGIVGTATGEADQTAERSAKLAREMLQLMNIGQNIPVYEGAQAKLQSTGLPARSAGIEAIIGEALREDTRVPLFVAVGGGLTEIASALLFNPGIANRMTVVWIGGIGQDRDSSFEYNFNIDPVAAQYLFNEATVPFWQIPWEAYATCVVSAAELQANVAPCGAIGRWLYERYQEGTRKVARMFNTGETWTLGDNPLVLVTALSTWVPGQMGNNVFEEIYAPRVDAQGRLEARTNGRKIRVYRSLDTRIMFSDFYSKLRLHSG